MPVPGSWANRSIAQRNAASVLPEPVGAITSVWSPSAMDSQAWAWASVGAVKVPPNQRRVAGANRSSGVGRTLVGVGWG